MITKPVKVDFHSINAFFFRPISGQFQFQVLAQFLQIRQIFCDFFFYKFDRHSIKTQSFRYRCQEIWSIFFWTKTALKVFLPLNWSFYWVFFSFLRWLQWPKVKSSEILNVYWQFQDKGSLKCFANSPKYFILTKKFCFIWDAVID